MRHLRDALALAALLEEAQKTFAVRMEKIRRRAAEGLARSLVKIARDREDAFGPEEPSLVIFGSQLARSACASLPPIASMARE